MQILTRQQLQDEFSKFTNDPKTIDLETNAVPLWNPSSTIVTISMGGINSATRTWTGFQIPVAHREGQNCDPDVVLRFLEFIDGARLIPFWVPMEASWLLAKYGIRPNWVGDAYFIARIAQLKDAGLKDLVFTHLQRKPLQYEEVCTHPSKDFSYVHAQDPKGIRYTIDDSVNAGQLEAVLKAKYIAPHNMQAVYELEVQIAAMMAEHAWNGYLVDVPHLNTEIKAEEDRVKELEAGIFNTMGVGKFAINSSVQLGKAVKAAWGLSSPRRTEKGAESWAQDAIQALIFSTKRTHPVAASTLKAIIEWKSKFSTVNNLRKRSSDITPDGRLHPDWKTIGFDGTSRIYSEGPSLTSLPQPARRAFHAAEGKVWVKFDWRQAEIRILASLSGDKALAAALNSGDYHRAVYSGMSGVPFDQVTKEQRESSKVISYSILYSGGSAWHVAQELGITEEEAAREVGKYFRLFPTLETYLKGIRQTAVNTYHVRTWMNRLRRLEGNDLQKIQNQACNAVGQQSCGTLLKVAMLKMHSFALSNHPLMKGFSEPIPVFDAMFYQIDSDVPLDAHLKFIKELVELDLNGIKLEAEFAVGPSWGNVSPVQEGMASAVADFTTGARPEYEEKVKRETPEEDPIQTLFPIEPI